MVDYPDIIGPQPVGATPMTRTGEVRVRIFRRPPKRGPVADEHKEESPGRFSGQMETAKALIEKVNNDLVDHGTPVHLSLIPAEGRLFLDIYDCTDNEVCSLIREEDIPLEGLPALVDKLRQEIGLLVDTVS